MWYVDIMQIYFEVKKKKTTICNLVNLKNTMLPEKKPDTKSMISFTETLKQTKTNLWRQKYKQWLLAGVWD